MVKEDVLYCLTMLSCWRYRVNIITVDRVIFSQTELLTFDADETLALVDHAYSSHKLWNENRSTINIAYIPNDRSRLDLVNYDEYYLYMSLLPAIRP